MEINKNYKIYDCFMFWNEFDLLHLRLDYLYDKIDYFIICESKDSHSKKIRKKKFIFKQYLHLYEPYMDKIIYLPIKNLPFEGDNLNSWKNENFQRKFLFNEIKKLNKNDLIIISDLDEIVSKKAISDFENSNYQIAVCKQKLYYYYINLIQNQKWNGPIICRKNILKNSDTIQTLRNNRKNKINNFLSDGGWHYSFMGGLNRIKYKIDSIVEGEKFNNNENFIEKCLKLNKDLLNREKSIFEKKIIDIKIDNNSPDNIEKFISLYPYLYKN